MGVWAEMTTEQRSAMMKQVYAEKRIEQQKEVNVIRFMRAAQAKLDSDRQAVRDFVRACAGRIFR